MLSALGGVGGARDFDRRWGHRSGEEHGTYLDMDIYDDECIQAAGRTGNIPADFLVHDHDLGEIQRRNFTKAVKAGVKMAFGTDAGSALTTSRHASLHLW
jgi:imidazolonepropionase-like amidohydrolase